MTYFKKISSILLLCLLFSCKKKGCTDNHAVNYDASAQKNIGCIYNTCISGVYDSTYNFHEFSPAYEFTYTYDPNTFLEDGTGGLDLDEDGINDVIFSNVTAYVDSGFTGDMSNGVPRLDVHSLNGYEIGIYQAAVWTVPNTSSTWPYACKLPHEHTFVSENGALFEWENSAHMWWGYSAVAPLGAWISSQTSPAYLSVSKGSRHGWIEFDMSDRDHPKIISYAMQE